MLLPPIHFYPAFSATQIGVKVEATEEEDGGFGQWETLPLKETVSIPAAAAAAAFPQEDKI